MAALEGGKSEARQRDFWRKAHGERLQSEHQVDISKLGRLNHRLQLNDRGKVHLLLATVPLSRLEQIYKLVFEKILNEKVSTVPVVQVRN